MFPTHIAIVELHGASKACAPPGAQAFDAPCSSTIAIWVGNIRILQLLNYMAHQKPVLLLVCPELDHVHRSSFVRAVWFWSAKFFVRKHIEFQAIVTMITEGCPFVENPVIEGGEKVLVVDQKSKIKTLFATGYIYGKR